MKPQARPFSVEIKSRRRNAPLAVPASAAPQDDWMDTIPPDGLPERDVHEDLSDGPSQSEARREAERVFARLNGQAQPSKVKDDPAPSGSPIGTPEAPAPRVLPDLLAGAREEERTMVEKPKRTRVPKPTKVKRSRKTKSPGPRLKPPEPAPEPAAEIAPEPTAQATMSQSRRAKQRVSKLPPGQRWKERRLPRVSWERQVRSR
jgi:hypothetical protein